MATLGELLAAARNDAAGFAGWIAVTNPELAARLEEAARGHDLDPAGFVGLAIADFTRLASEEDWGRLMSAVRGGDDPGMACLMAMVDWRTAAPSCAHHSGDGHEGHGHHDHDHDHDHHNHHHH